jgi:hypothetical protein
VALQNYLQGKIFRPREKVTGKAELHTMTNFNVSGEEMLSAWNKKYTQNLMETDFFGVEAKIS